MPGRVRRQFTPSGLSVPCLGSVIRPLATTPTVFDTSASYPAGAFHTPRLVSSRAITPATKPDGGITRGSPVAGAAGRREGEDNAAVLLLLVVCATSRVGLKSALIEAAKPVWCAARAS